ncbi:MAG: flagellar biosynthetic protein FliR [Planctomycetes bacterium]|nr:flagellar biosynthetic protein FliR [Planctomycetota bacterium]
MDLAQLASLGQYAAPLSLVMARIGALFFTAPLLGGALVPMRVKSLMTLAISVLLLPVVRPLLPAEIPADGRFILLLAQEIAVGATIGFACTCVFEGVRAGGELINRYAGFTAAESFDPDSGIGEGPIGDMLLVGMVLVFFAADAHHFLIASVAASFGAVPVGSWTMEPRLLHMAAEATGQCMQIACMVSFPVLAVIMLVTVAEGVLSKAVPQINILFMSFAIKILVSLLVLYAGMPAIVGFMGACIGVMQRLAGTAVAAM